MAVYIHIINKRLTKTAFIQQLV